MYFCMKASYPPTSANAETENKSSNKAFVTEISNGACEREEKSLLNVDIKILSWDVVYYLTHSLVLRRQCDSVIKGLWQYA